MVSFAAWTQSCRSSAADPVRSNLLIIMSVQEHRGGRQRLLMLSLLMMIIVTAAAPQEPSDPDTRVECGCGGRMMRRGRIVGGEELEKNSAPWLAALSRGRKSHCGAALISGIHLLTAAHCIEGLAVSELTAWLGVHSLSEAGLVMAERRRRRSLYRDFVDVEDDGDIFGRSIAQAFPHPEFDASTFRNDIAVLELRFPVKISLHLYPICLPINDEEQYARRMATVAGWGRVGEQQPPSDVPRQATVEVWSKAECQNSGYPKSRLRGSVICAGFIQGGLDACQGDSGGPLTVPGQNGNTEIIGVVSWGRGCARPKLPGVYTRVSGYLPFLKEIMSNTCPDMFL